MLFFSFLFPHHILTHPFVENNTQSHLLRDPALWPGQTGGIRQASLQGTIYCGITLLFSHEFNRKNRLHWLSRQSLKEKFCSFLLDLFLLLYIYTLLWEKDPTNRERKLEKAPSHHQTLPSFFFFFSPLPVAGRTLRPFLLIEHDIFIPLFETFLGVLAIFLCGSWPSNRIFR